MNDVAYHAVMTVGVLFVWSSKKMLTAGLACMTLAGKLSDREMAPLVDEYEMEEED